MLIFLFLVLLIIVLVFLFTGINTTAANVIDEPGSFIFRTMLLITIWLAYIFTLCFAGIFSDFSLPPRIPLMLVLPFLVFLIYFFTQARFRPLIRAVPAHWPVYFQSFRIAVELLIFIAFTKGIVPRMVTYEGYNFDILAGLSAPIIGYLIARGIRGSRTILFIWNILGLLLLVNVVIIFNTVAYFPQLWGATSSLIKPAYGMLPIALLAGVLMPAAVFMHILSLVRMHLTRNDAQ